MGGALFLLVIVGGVVTPATSRAVFLSGRLTQRLSSRAGEPDELLLDLLRLKLGVKLPLLQVLQVEDLLADRFLKLVDVSLELFHLLLDHVLLDRAAIDVVDEIL